MVCSIPEDGLQPCRMEQSQARAAAGSRAPAGAAGPRQDPKIKQQLFFDSCGCHTGERNGIPVSHRIKEWDLVSHRIKEWGLVSHRIKEWSLGVTQDKGMESGCHTG